ncbi:DinB family protein [Aporhodopirellula aestuarii]|uniref:DinB family protein n=1 Tax=Aporhodopirellula aestuarii TaxID=2950107 RepID=A0ABT0UC48_9BACT|nr:DinB family protein [Aporhodopirellula aestuarii]MCM2374387.1 DinB family protein [Aporhodopirellula aestuarii]
MNAIEVLKQIYSTSQMVMSSYVSDLTDEELLTRPNENCNHIAWQLGHLIVAENQLLQSVVPGHSVELPDGFAEHHAKENATSNDASQFLSKDGYLELFAKMKESTFAALDALSEEDLDKPGPEHLASMFPTVGSVLGLVSTHVMMHVGQFVPVRRALGKPVII